MIFVSLFSFILKNISEAFLSFHTFTCMRRIDNERVFFFKQENAALCDEIAHLEEKFLRAKEERRLVRG